MDMFWRGLRHGLQNFNSRHTSKNDDFGAENIDVGPYSDAFQVTICEIMHRFSAIFPDSEHFSIKIVYFSASDANRLFNIVGSVPELKIITFCKAWPRRRNFVIFTRFFQGPHRCFSEKSRFRSMFWRVPGDDSGKNALIFRDFSRSGAFFDQNRLFFCFRCESFL